MEDKTIDDLKYMFGVEGGIVSILPSGKTSVTDLSEVDLKHYEAMYLTGEMFGVKFSQSKSEFEKNIESVGAVGLEDEIAKELAQNGIVVILTALDSCEFFLPNSISEIQKNIVLDEVIDSYPDKTFAVSEDEIEVISIDELKEKINKLYENYSKVR